MDSEFLELELENTKFMVEYDPRNAKVLSISYDGINCIEYIWDYDALYEEIQELVCQLVE